MDTITKRSELQNRIKWPSDRRDSLKILLFAGVTLLWITPLFSGISLIQIVGSFVAIFGFIFIFGIIVDITKGEILFVIYRLILVIIITYLLPLSLAYFFIQTQFPI
jgi:hypothetical protein